MFKLKNDIYPEYLKSLIVQSYRSNLRFSPSIDHTFSYADPYIWNSSPSNIICCNQLLIFRDGLKTFLFSKFMEEHL